VNPYPIAYRSLTPKRDECANLLVPVALSSSHIAFGSIRMEPVFMLLGQSAATAASMAIDDEVAVQDVDYPKLREKLLKDGQILEFKGRKRNLTRSSGIDPKELEGIIIDNEQAELEGPWQSNNVTHPRVGDTYVHDGNAARGECVATYKVEVKQAGRHQVLLSFPPNPNRATNVPVSITVGGKTETFRLNQKKPGTHGAFTLIGEFDVKDLITVTLSNEGANGYVIADAVQVLRMKE